MSVQEKIPYVSYIANGSTAKFNIPFDLHNAGYLVVTVDKMIPAVGGYIVNLNDMSITFVTAPRSGAQVELYRDTKLKRDTNYQSYDNSFRPSSVNFDFDSIWQALQDQHMVDARIAARIREEIEQRRVADGLMQGQIEILNQVILSVFNDASSEYVANKLTELNSIIQTAAAAGAGANGWTASLVVDGNETQHQINNQTVRHVESIADLLAIQNPKEGQVVYVKSYHAGLHKGGGLFEYKPTRQSENDGGNIINGWERKVTQSYLNPHNYGATGGGVDDNNDHFAFNRIANVVKTSNKNHFTIHIPDDDYIVGYQTFTTGTGWKYTDVLNIGFAQMTNKHVLMKSDSARIKIKDNMRYGVFHKTTGEPFETVMPWYPGTASYAQTGSIAARVDIGYTINVENIKTFVFSGDIDLDGNMANCVLGGKYGDTGWQVGAYGMRICRVERFSIENIKTHDHCLDGLYIAGCNSQTTPDIFNPDYRGIVRNVQSLRNGRQGCSFAGGQNISWYDCNFADTALPTFKVQSMPKSCFDIEAEVDPIRNARFYNCFFGDAPSNSLVADSGYTKNVHFYSCRFVNSLGLTAWVRKPQFKFFNCYFNGYMEGQYMTSVPEDRTLYEQCEFTDDPVVNPNFKDYGRYLINSWGANPIFNDCVMNLHKSGIVGNYDYAGKLRPEFNNIIVNIYGTNASCAWQGNITVRIRDYREGAARTTFYPTIVLESGKIVIEKMDTIANKIIPYGVPCTVEDTIKSDSVVYLPKGVTVANATGTDDTATKLNALIASLKAANYIA